VADYNCDYLDRRTQHGHYATGQDMLRRQKNEQPADDYQPGRDNTPRTRMVDHLLLSKDISIDSISSAADGLLMWIKIRCAQEGSPNVQSGAAATMASYVLVGP
jgi:hypothetical protein